MKKIFGKRLVIIFLFLVIGFFAVHYILYGGARDIQAEESAFTLNSSTITAEFNANSVNATTKYLNKTIEVKGKVTKVENDLLILDNSIICKMKNKINIPNVGASINIKGRVVGFDDLMGEINLDECSIINK
jgi:hypothetical protein